jgi:hypothetical protein
VLFVNCKSVKFHGWGSWVAFKNTNAAANPSFERTHTGMRQLAFISFWANCRTPVWAAQLKR